MNLYTSSYYKYVYKKNINDINHPHSIIIQKNKVEDDVRHIMIKIWQDESKKKINGTTRVRVSVDKFINSFIDIFV